MWVHGTSSTLEQDKGTDLKKKHINWTTKFRFRYRLAPADYMIVWETNPRPMFCFSCLVRTQHSRTKKANIKQEYHCAATYPIWSQTRPIRYYQNHCYRLELQGLPHSAWCYHCCCRLRCWNITMPTHTRPHPHLLLNAPLLTIRRSFIKGTDTDITCQPLIAIFPHIPILVFCYFQARIFFP